MRGPALLSALALLALSAPPAAASCVVPGVFAARGWARPGETVHVGVAGGRGQPCRVGSPPGTPTPETQVTLYLSRPDLRVTLATFRQRGFTHDLTVRIPAGTPEGLWVLRTDSGLRGEERFRVGGPALPRTAAPATLPLAAVGTWLVAAGAYAVRRGR